MRGEAPVFIRCHLRKRRAIGAVNMYAGDAWGVELAAQYRRIGKYHIGKAADIGAGRDQNFFFQPNFIPLIQPHKRHVQQLCQAELAAVPNGKGIGQGQESQRAIIRQGESGQGISLAVCADACGGQLSHGVAYRLR